jgi:ferrous iron transport protein A
MHGTQILLDQLPMGQSGRVASLKTGGSVKRRMLDLGIVEGTLIEALYRSPSGNPVAYLIRGAVIALRSDDSEKIMVVPEGDWA